MSDSPASAPAPASPVRGPRRVRKRLAIPLSFALLTVLALLIIWIRGTWATTEPYDPQRSDEGIVTELVAVGEARQVRCAVVVDRPLEDVWAAVTDYQHFPQIFPHVTRAETRTDGDLVELDGTLTTPIGAWDFAARLHHAHSPERATVTWDDSGADLRVNRGSWVLTRLDQEHTLLVYTLEIELPNYPSFLVRTTLLAGQPRVIEALLVWLEQPYRPSSPSPSSPPSRPAP